MVLLVLREDAPAGRNASSRSGTAANSGMGVATPVMERMGTKGHHAFPDEGVPFLWFLEREGMQEVLLARGIVKRNFGEGDRPRWSWLLLATVDDNDNGSAQTEARGGGGGEKEDQGGLAGSSREVEREINGNGSAIVTRLVQRGECQHEGQLTQTVGAPGLSCGVVYDCSAVDLRPAASKTVAAGAGSAGLAQRQEGRKQDKEKDSRDGLENFEEIWGLVYKGNK
ncbi:hypothetical protein E2562_018882 [Oryza meyeriana var. granulata]|uniref:Uncharacterized protein n=1 Tax=Oryza meyeriana var. granulata TaxID=110450 RepID=A0A6G1F9X5_9ORYZ|nr:hypothetical protein E2562_018882 [Oryza meyeriana var. granulata]